MSSGQSASRERSYVQALELVQVLSDALLDVGRLNHGPIDQAQMLALIRDLDEARDRAHSIVSLVSESLKHDLVRDLVRELDHAGNNARETDLALKNQPAATHTPGRNFNLALTHACAVVRARDLELIRNLARALADLLQYTPLDASDRGMAARRRAVSPSAAWLLRASTRLLSSVDQLRYGEEFRVELRELASGGANRFQQMSYAGRQARSMLRLRAALRVPQRRGAGP